MRLPKIKTKQELEDMAMGGKILGKVKNALAAAVKAGGNAAEIEAMAVKMIRENGAACSFMMVPGYSWATCINVNDGIVHGIPVNTLVFKDGDIVSVDVGVFYKGFHTDTSISVLIGNNKEKARFLETGKLALKNAIKKANPGNTIGDISAAIEHTLRGNGVSPVYSLVGHGVGRELHEPPYIPCFVSGSADEAVILKPGMTIAIEVMYTLGSPDLVRDEDGWTIRTKDGKISGLFEETVMVAEGGSVILTS